MNAFDPRIIEFSNEATVLLEINGTEQLWHATTDTAHHSMTCAVTGQPIKSNIAWKRAGKASKRRIAHESLISLPKAE